MIPSASDHRRTLATLALVALFTAGCADRTTCCSTPDCSGGSDEIVGSEALQFRGKVPTNLLFMSIDTLRKDHVGVYGDLDRTPFLDSIAREGVVMNDHFTCSNWTFAGMTCTLAGRSHVERGHVPRLFGGALQRPPVPEGTPFLASWLGDEGYDTVVVSTNPWFSEKNGNTQGYHKEGKPVGEGRRVGPKGLSLMDGLRGSSNKPWFLHLHYKEPHPPYRAPAKLTPGLDDLEPWPEKLTTRKSHYGQKKLWPDLSKEDQDLLEAHLREMYGGDVQKLDGWLESFWKDLDRKCWLDDTLVVVWNDHGEAFWEHGAQTHAYNLTAEENDGVLFFWAKNIVPGRWDQPTAATDLVPTILDLFELPIPPEVTGLPIGTAPADRAILTASLGRLDGVQAIIRDGLKLQYNWRSGDLRLWDRKTDPTEKDNLYVPGHREAQSLWAELVPEVHAMAELIINENPSPKWPKDVPPP